MKILIPKKKVLKHKHQLTREYQSLEASAKQRIHAERQRGISINDKPNSGVLEMRSLCDRQIADQSKELGLAVIDLSQLGRGVEPRTKKHPMLSDLRESGSIEQEADLVLMIYRDEYYYPATPDRGITEVIVTKHRNGPVGTVKLLFEPQFTRFRNLAD